MFPAEEEDDSDLMDGDEDEDEDDADAITTGAGNAGQRQGADGAAVAPEGAANVLSSIEAELLQTFGHIKAVVAQMRDAGEDAETSAQIIKKHCVDAVDAIEVRARCPRARCRRDPAAAPAAARIGLTRALRWWLPRRS